MCFKKGLEGEAVVNLVVPKTELALQKTIPAAELELRPALLGARLADDVGKKHHARN